MSELKDIGVDSTELIDVPLVFDEEGNATDGFKVVGADSSEYQAADREWKVRNVRKSARRGRGIEAATESGAVELVNLVDRREFAICAACVKEVYGFTVNGAPAPLTEGTLKEIFTKRPTWRIKTVNAIEANQVFTKPSSAAGTP